MATLLCRRHPRTSARDGPCWAEEEFKWDQGGKGNSAANAKVEKAAEHARKKADLERLKRDDEAALLSRPPKGKQKLSAQAAKRDAKAQTKAKSFTAENIDDAIDALSLVTEKTDAASKGSKAADIERHPERRFKAAFEAFKERRVPELRKEMSFLWEDWKDEAYAHSADLASLHRAQNPGLRLQQVQDLAYKDFRNPTRTRSTKVHLNYDADKGARMAALDSVRSG
ncbi:unnamed protein product, partial [Tilletia laevis]